MIDLIESPNPAPITLITAPAGFGKTTLAAQWVARSQQRSAWISLRPEGNTPARFLGDLLRALEPDRERSGPVKEPSLGDILDRLRVLSEIGQMTIIFDDYHVIENDDVHGVMNALAHELPTGISLILLSRTMPPLSLGRLRAQGQVRDLTEVHLRFTQPEARALIVAQVGTRLTPQQTARLAERTDGWVVGLHLALLALDPLAPNQIDPFIEGMAETQWLDDYVVDEVLDALRPEMRDFVLRTAFLGPLTAELCDTALGREDGNMRLDEVVRLVVFARRDPQGGPGVTYHHLFAECVARIARRLLPAGELQAQHRRAAAWLARHGHLEEAVEQALNGNDLALAVRLTKTLVRDLMDVDLSHSVIYWLGRLPRSAVASDPELAYGYIYAQFLIGQAREARLMLNQVERVWMASGDPVQQGRALACRVYSLVLWGDSTEAELQTLRHQALALLPEEYAVERLHLWGGIFAEACFHGNDEEAEHAFRKAEYYASRLPSEQMYWLVPATIQRPNQAALRGNLPVAIALYELAVKQLPAPWRYWEGIYHLRLATIHLERDDLAAAQAEAAHFEPELETSPWEAWHAQTWLLSAQIKRASGEPVAAYALLERALVSLDAASIPRVAHHARALQASWWLVDGELALACGWDQTTPAAQLDWGRTYGHMHPQLTRIQLRFTEGEYIAALDIALELIAEGERLKRWAEVIPFYAWEAQIQCQLGDHEAALTAIRAALRHGMHGGFVRSFFPLGTNLRPIYASVRSKLPTEEAAYLTTLLNAVPQTTCNSHPQSSSHSVPGSLIRSESEVLALLQDGRSSEESAAGGAPSTAGAASAAGSVEFEAMLSRREEQVLSLLSRGLSNRRIAEDLFISDNTVKKHISNIFRKLDVTSRTTAVFRARALGLLEERSPR